MKRSLLSVESLVSIAIAALACGCTQQSDRSEQPPASSWDNPPLIVVSIDTLRSDHLPAYGYTRVQTPAIDALAADGVLFERAYSPVPLTLPAHASLLTGRLPPSHGVRDNAGYRLDDAVQTLTERLKQRGYATGAAVSSFTMRTETGLAQGFDFYDDRFVVGERETIGEIQRAGNETLAAALPWLHERGNEPFFFFLHLYEPHTPYDPPPQFAGRNASAYDDEIEAADAVVAKLLQELKALGLYAQAAVVLLSDHGEGLGDHGEDEHGILVYREALQIPLVMKLPGSVRAGHRVTQPVQLSDVAVTLLELAGDTSPGDMEGVSLLKTPPTPRLIYGESYHPQLRFGWSALRSVIRGRHHYIQGAVPELYDLVEDRHEQDNIAQEERRISAELRDLLAAIEPRLQSPFAEQTETQQALASLGYLSNSGNDDDRAADPRSRLHTLEPLRQGIDALRRGEAQLAESKLRQALEANPRSIDGWQFLGLSLTHQGRPSDAFDAYQEAFRLSNGSPLLAAPMAEAALRAGRVQRAIVLLQAAVEHDPEKLELRFLLAQALLGSKRFDQALALAEATVGLAPDNADAHYQLGVIHMAKRNLLAEEHFRRALEIDPVHAAALNDLGVLMMADGRPSEARALFNRLLTIQPDNESAKRHLRQLETSES